VSTGDSGNRAQRPLGRGGPPVRLETRVPEPKRRSCRIGKPRFHHPDRGGGLRIERIALPVSAGGQAIGLLGSKNRPLGLETKVLGLKTEVRSLKAQVPGLENEVPGLKNRPLGLENEVLGFGNDSRSFEIHSPSSKDHSLSPKNHSLALENHSLELIHPAASPRIRTAKALILRILRFISRFSTEGG
jgi:hypothetical protein